MSTDATLTDDESEVFTPIPLEELCWYWLDNSAPLFIANRESICDHIEAHGFQIYYVMGLEKYWEKATPQSTQATVERRKPSIMKVVNNFVGRAIVDASDEIELDVLTQSAWFNLPKIPYSIYAKVEAFLRAVDDAQHTEAIVLLTFDPSYGKNPDGWGVLVPTQKNTAADCDYSPESIMEEKPEDVVVVGSIHSHPGMSAYASGTDHKDQAHFDGIHLTMGWMSSKGNATELYAEQQMGGHAFVLDPTDVIESQPPKAPVPEEITDWMTKVTKATYTTNYNNAFTGSANPTTGSAGTSSFSSPGTGRILKSKLPTDIPDVEKNYVIGELKSAMDTRCPFCDTSLMVQEINKRRCSMCHSFICEPHETFEEIVGVRDEMKIYTHEFDLTSAQAKPIYIWRRTGGVDSFEPISVPKAQA